MAHTMAVVVSPILVSRAGNIRHNSTLKDTKDEIKGEDEKSSRESAGSTSSSTYQPRYSHYLDSNIASYRTISKFSDLPQEFGYNQHISIDDKVRQQLKDTLWKFKAPIRYAFAYGSGVFSQGSSSYSSTLPQVDLIFGVSHTEHWHSLNMKQYPEHYSSLRYLGSGAVSVIQDNIGSGVYFNPFVEINGMKIKYGVVNIDTLLNDLQGWETLYLAGRLHKPVKILRDEPKVRFVNQANLISVLRTSLLLLPEKFNELELYKMIAGVSYMGDPRMQFGENPHKVHNIVSNQFMNFRKLYSPLMDDLPNLSICPSGDNVVVSGMNSNSPRIEVANLVQDMDPIKRGNMVFRLPSEFRTKIYSRYASKFNSPELATIDKNTQQKYDPSVKSVSSDFDRQIASDKNLSSEVARAIRYTVSWPSITQTAKGILTAGVVKSMKYSYEKISKYRLGKQTNV